MIYALQLLPLMALCLIVISAIKKPKKSKGSFVVFTSAPVINANFFMIVILSSPEKGLIFFFFYAKIKLSRMAT